MPRDEREQVDRRTLLKAVGGAAATVSVAGCGGTQTTPTEDSDGGDNEDTSTETETSDEGDESAFEVGATLGQMDSGLDPHDHAETPTNIIVSQVYEGLMGRDKEGGITAKLATEWERVESGMVRFTLRDGVTFHNGDPVTSEDVRYSIRRVETEEVGGALPQDGDLAGSKALENVDAGDGEVTVTFGGLNPIVFALFATNGQIMQQSWVENNENSYINRNTNGTGPFRVTGYQSGTSVSYEKYEDYWGEPAAADEATITASSESATRVNQLVAGETDIVTNVPPQEISRVESSEGTSVTPVPSTRIIFLQMRYDVEPFSSQQFRQAMNYAVDVQVKALSRTSSRASARSPASRPSRSSPGTTPTSSRTGTIPSERSNWSRNPVTPASISRSRRRSAAT